MDFYANDTHEYVVTEDGCSPNLGQTNPLFSREMNRNSETLRHPLQDTLQMHSQQQERELGAFEQNNRPLRNTRPDEGKLHREACELELAPGEIEFSDHGNIHVVLRDQSHTKEANTVSDEPALHCGTQLGAAACSGLESVVTEMDVAHKKKLKSKVSRSPQVAPTESSLGERYAKAIEPKSKGRSFFLRHQVTLIYCARSILIAVALATSVFFLSSAGDRDFYDCMAFVESDPNTLSSKSFFLKIGTVRSFSGHVVVSDFLARAKGTFCPTNSGGLIFPETYLQKVKIAAAIATTSVGLNFVSVISTVLLRKIIKLREGLVFSFSLFCISAMQVALLTTVIVLLRSKSGWPRLRVESSTPYPYMGGYYEIQMCYESRNLGKVTAPTHVIIRDDQYPLIVSLAFSVIDLLAALGYVVWKVEYRYKFISTLHAYLARQYLTVQKSKSEPKQKK